MYSTRISSKCLILLASFSLCLVRQAFSRTCYVCESSINETCFTNNNHGAFQIDCAQAITEISNSNDESSEYLQALMKRYSTGYSSESISNFGCVTVIGKTISEERIVKACIPKMESCRTLVASMISSGLLIDSCSRCDADLCNMNAEDKVSILTNAEEKESTLTNAEEESTLTNAEEESILTNAEEKPSTLTNAEEKVSIPTNTEEKLSTLTSTQEKVSTLTINHNNAKSSAEAMKSNYLWIGFLCVSAFLRLYL